MKNESTCVLFKDFFMRIVDVMKSNGIGFDQHNKFLELSRMFLNKV